MIVIRALCCCCRDRGIQNHHRATHELLEEEELYNPQYEISPGVEMHETKIHFEYQQKIENITKDIKKDDDEEILDAIMKLVNLLDGIRAKAVLLNTLINTEKAHSREPQHLLDIIKNLGKKLDTKQKTELFSILADLPAGVLGDVEDRNASRVLIDVYDDVSQSLTDERINISSQNDIVEMIGSTIEQLLFTNPNAIFIIPEILLNEQFTANDRIRIVMQQIILSRLLPTDKAKRSTFLNMILA